jgi:hypothetical protein
MRLPDAALAFRRGQAPPLTGLADLGAMNITAAALKSAYLL